MNILAVILLAVGAIIALVSAIQLLICAFRTSVLWGLAYIFVPFVALIFIIVHWDDAKSPFLRGLIAIPFYVVGGVLLHATSSA